MDFAFILLAMKYGYFFLTLSSELFETLDFRGILRGNILDYSGFADFDDALLFD